MDVKDNKTKSFSLKGCNPSPTSGVVNINFEVMEPGNTTIEAFDLAGRKVSSIFNQFTEAGVHMATWKTSSFSAGTYVIRLTHNEETITTKILITN